MPLFTEAGTIDHSIYVIGWRANLGEAWKICIWSHPEIEDSCFKTLRKVKINIISEEKPLEATRVMPFVNVENLYWNLGQLEIANTRSDTHLSSCNSFSFFIVYQTKKWTIGAMTVMDQQVPESFWKSYELSFCVTQSITNQPLRL